MSPVNPNCPNCDGRGCMGCIFREYDHECADDCPTCCPEFSPPVGAYENPVVSVTEQLVEEMRGLRSDIQALVEALKKRGPE